MAELSKTKTAIIKSMRERIKINREEIIRLERECQECSEVLNALGEGNEIENDNRSGKR